MLHRFGKMNGPRQKPVVFNEGAAAGPAAGPPGIHRAVG